MSHFTVLVEVPKDCEWDIERAKAQLASGNFLPAENLVEGPLAPFDENMRVEEHDSHCFCIGHKAMMDVRKACDEKFGTFDHLRDVCKKIVLETYGECPKPSDEDAFRNYQKKQEQIWKDITKDRFAFEEESLEKHPDKDKPDPDCVECNGTGIVQSTYNTESKWDWWTVGGRWTGLFSDYDPTKDPANLEVCTLCCGTGDRDDWVYYTDQEGKRLDAWQNGQHIKQLRDDFDELTRCFKDDWSEKCNGCNACYGKGQKLAFSFKCSDTDIFTAKHALDWLENNSNSQTFAILDKNGEWHEKGSMGWWAIVADQKEEDAWDTEYMDVVKKAAEDDSYFVLVDCHI